MAEHAPCKTRVWLAIACSPELVEVDEFERGLQRPAQLYKARAGFTFIA